MTGKKTINWTLNVNIPGGPSISGSKPLDVEAYDVIELEIPKKQTTEILIEPSENTKVKFLLIKAEPSGDLLSYQVSDGTKHTEDIVLDVPMHIYIGTGCVKALQYSPKSLSFTNGMKNDKDEDVPVSLQILVGRDATS